MHLHRDFVIGVATYAHELFSATDDLDTVYVPIGLGSGICGLIGTRDALGLKTKIVGVVSEAANAYFRSFTAGRVVETNSALTFADGMAVRVPDPIALEVIRKGAERVIEVSDEEIAEAIRNIYTAIHNCAEGAGAATLAALCKERGRLQGRRAAVILTGRGRARIQHFFSWLDGRLSDNEFICGPHFTIADITGMVTLDFCTWVKLKPTDHLTHLNRWHSAVSAHPSAKA
jgi:threonine dehydratase